MDFEIPDECDLISKFIKSTPDGNVIDGDYNENPIVMYCSEECRSSSWDESHCIVCSILPTLQKLEIADKGFLALKIVIKACKTNGLKNILKLLAAEEKLEEIKKGFNDKGEYSSSDYSPIYWLVAHDEKTFFDTLFLSFLIAASVLHCLETMTDFFSDIDVNEYKYEVGGLLLKHILNLLFNGYRVDEMIPSTKNHLEAGPLGKKTVPTGIAVYAVLSLLNHSCDPNVCLTCHRGDTFVLRAIRPIAKDEQ
ncbi:hypothetical protein L9F63_001504, partial [Diploptera punctata]